MGKMDTKVWAIRSEVLFQKRKWTGFSEENIPYYLDLFREKGEFLKRGPLETNIDYKQIIGQVILQVGNKFLLHQLTASSSEERLHKLWPIFLGGHIEEVDIQPNQDIVLTAIEREFNEEVFYQGRILEKKPLGIIFYEDGNLVNSVHVGLVYHFVGDSEMITSREADIGNPRFVTVGELEAMKDHLTYWSRVVLPKLHELV